MVPHTTDSLILFRLPAKSGRGRVHSADTGIRRSINQIIIHCGSAIRSQGASTGFIHRLSLTNWLRAGRGGGGTKLMVETQL